MCACLYVKVCAFMEMCTREKEEKGGGTFDVKIVVKY